MINRLCRGAKTFSRVNWIAWVTARLPGWSVDFVNVHVALLRKNRSLDLDRTNTFALQAWLANGLRVFTSRVGSKPSQAHVNAMEGPSLTRGRQLAKPGTYWIEGARNGHNAIEPLNL